jgi:cyclopropane fatty-acyl-phospholipid synthase-like methyltransferase
MMSFINSFRGKGYKDRLLHPKDEFFDGLFGVKTFAYKKYSDDMSDPVWKGDYMPTSYQNTLALLKAAGISKDSVVIDFGCGLGRVVFAAAHLGAKKSIGVEFDEDLFRAAESNRISSKFKDKVSFSHTDASQFNIPNDANIFFFFNPFGAGTMADVVAKIEESIKTTPRKTMIVYYNPQFQTKLLASDQFKLKQEWPAGKVKYTTQFWGN